MFKAVLMISYLLGVSSKMVAVTADGFANEVPTAVVNNNNDNNYKCVDKNKDCSFWAGIGECEKNPRYMLSNCQVSCDSCDYVGIGEALAQSKETRELSDAAGSTASVEDATECAEGDNFCKAAKIKAAVPKGSNAAGSARKVDVAKCEDRHTTCTRWQKAGECEINPGWMIVNCPASCNACHLLDPRVRCARKALNVSETPAFIPGAMNQMFSSLEERFNDRYGVTVHSTSPWVVTFDHFVTDEEADALIAQQTKFERSTDSGKINEYGETGRVLSTGRTSSNSWCGKECEKHPLVDNLLTRMEEVVGIKRQNYESFQVLRCKSVRFCVNYISFCIK